MQRKKIKNLFCRWNLSSRIKTCLFWDRVISRLDVLIASSRICAEFKVNFVSTDLCEMGAPFLSIWALILRQVNKILQIFAKHNIKFYWCFKADKFDLQRTKKKIRKHILDHLSYAMLNKSQRHHILRFIWRKLLGLDSNQEIYNCPSYNSTLQRFLILRDLKKIGFTTHHLHINLIYGTFIYDM